MKALIIYDATGRIWNVTYGEDILPTGLSGMVADVPEGRSVYGIDFSGSIPKARYEELPKTEVEQISGKIDALSESINHLVTGSVVPMTVACSFIAETFTDDQAVQVPGLYPEWDGNGTAYKTGTRLGMPVSFTGCYRTTHPRMTGHRMHPPRCLRRF